MQQLELVKRPSFRDWLSELLVSTLKPAYFVLRMRRKPWKTTMDDLAKMPDGTLGKDLSNFLAVNGLKLMPKAEFHDVFHVLFDYTTSMKDETCIQFIPLGNGKRSLPYIASTLVAAVFYPENWEDYFSAYLRGKKAQRFYDWNFEQFLHTPTVEVKKMIFG